MSAGWLVRPWLTEAMQPQAIKTASATGGEANLARDARLSARRQTRDRGRTVHSHVSLSLTSRAQHAVRAPVPPSLTALKGT
jgi:hypothetical protein